MFHKFIGIALIIDGAWSLATPKNNRWLVGDLGRWVRIGMGIILIW